MSASLKNGKLVIDLQEDDHLLTAKEIGVVIQQILQAIKIIKDTGTARTDRAHARLDDLEKTLGYVGPLIDDRISGKADTTLITQLRADLKTLKDFQQQVEDSSLPDDVESIFSTIHIIQNRVEEIGARIKENKPGAPGKNGAIPDHEWKGTQIRFQNPDGSWGPFVDLRGHPGPASISREEVFGSLQGVQRVRAGTGVTVTSDGNGGVIVNSTGGSGSSGSIIAATDSGDHKNYSLAEAPTTSSYYLIINGGIYTSDDPTYGAWSVTGSELTFSTALPADVASSVIKLVCV